MAQKLSRALLKFLRVWDCGLTRLPFTSPIWGTYFCTTPGGSFGKKRKKNIMAWPLRKGGRSNERNASDSHAVAARSQAVFPRPHPGGELVRATGSLVVDLRV